MRTYSAVMLDLARIYDETGGSPVTTKNASGLIRELADLPDKEYDKALVTLRTLGRITSVAEMVRAVGRR